MPDREGNTKVKKNDKATGREDYGGSSAPGKLPKGGQRKNPSMPDDQAPSQPFPKKRKK